MAFAASGRWRRAGALQWAPTRTAHDPNPPLPLEDVVAASGKGIIHEAGGADLTIGAIPDGYYLKRVGTTIVGTPT